MKVSTHRGISRNRACLVLFCFLRNTNGNSISPFTDPQITNVQSAPCHRPDLGRKLPPESVDFIKKNCKMNPQVQIYVSDGLSNSAIDENIREILPSLMDGLKHRGIDTGTPFFVRFGRVPTMDVISEITGAEVNVVLLGERPGLAAADSMSAYMAYKATVGMPESRRTVVSNIHKNGIQPVEAGAYLVEIIEKMLQTKSSGVDLVL